MEQRSSRGAWIASALALAVVGAGCTGSDVLVADRGDVSFQIGTSSTANPPFGYGTFQLSQIPFRSTDPDAVTAQPDPLTFLVAGIVDMNGGSSSTTLRVTSQEYAVLPFTLLNFNLNTDPTAPSATTCSGSTVTSVRPAYSVQITPDCVFRVPRSGAVTLQMSVDSAGLAALLASHVNCSNLQFTEPMPDEIEQFISFQCGP